MGRGRSSGSRYQERLPDLQKQDLGPMRPLWIPSLAERWQTTGDRKFPIRGSCSSLTEQ